MIATHSAPIGEENKPRGRDHTPYPIVVIKVAIAPLCLLYTIAGWRIEQEHGGNLLNGGEAQQFVADASQARH